MRNHRINAHRNDRGRNWHARHQAQITRLTITPEQEKEILMADCEKALEQDALYRVNVAALTATKEPLPEFNRNNLWRTLVMRALNRAGFNLRLARAMCLAYGFQPAS